MRPEIQPWKEGEGGRPEWVTASRSDGLDSCFNAAQCSILLSPARPPPQRPQEKPTAAAHVAKPRLLVIYAISTSWSRKCKAWLNVLMALGAAHLQPPLGVHHVLLHVARLAQHAADPGVHDHVRDLRCTARCTAGVRQ